ncbi:MAG TPA: hypothetical protein VFR41_01050, partial [Acidimicrobiia bacterium]|nr:hypothetical protein [Acidimicrobiia bacterium]
MIGQVPATIVHPPIDWFAIMPELCLFAAAIIIVLGRSLIRHDPRVRYAALLTAIAGVLSSGVFTFVQWAFVHSGPRHNPHGPWQALHGIVAVDGFGV